MGGLEGGELRAILGGAVGWLRNVGRALGTMEGTMEGDCEGWTLGFTEGMRDGDIVGESVGSAVGSVEGEDMTAEVPTLLSSVTWARHLPEKNAPMAANTVIIAGIERGLTITPVQASFTFDAKQTGTCSKRNQETADNFRPR